MGFPLLFFPTRRLRRVNSSKRVNPKLLHTPVSHRMALFGQRTLAPTHHRFPGCTGVNRIATFFTPTEKYQRGHGRSTVQRCLHDKHPARARFRRSGRGGWRCVRLTCLYTSAAYELRSEGKAAVCYVSPGTAGLTIAPSRSHSIDG